MGIVVRMVAVVALLGMDKETIPISNRQVVASALRKRVRAIATVTAIGIGILKVAVRKVGRINLLSSKARQVVIVIELLVATVLPAVVEAKDSSRVAKGATEISVATTNVVAGVEVARRVSKETVSSRDRVSRPKVVSNNPVDTQESPPSQWRPVLLHKNPSARKCPGSLRRSLGIR